jgi:hypothetical protein
MPVTFGERKRGAQTGNRLTALNASRIHPTPATSTTTFLMGQQTNKIEKRRRRLNYLERQKIKAKAAAAAKPAAKPKKAAPKKEKAEAAPVAE